MSLAAEIADYRYNQLRILREEERFFKTLSFATAVEYAASGAGPHWGIHPHQRRIGVNKLRQGLLRFFRHLIYIDSGPLPSTIHRTVFQSEY
jgi:hypothetical protein